jgi:CheY-like chemotaxis protein
MPNPALCASDSTRSDAFDDHDMTLARPDDPPAEGVRVLVAEDNRLNSLLIAEQLRLLAFLPEVVASGREALARWRSGAFALVLTDLNMPDMDGYALAGAIRAEEGAGPRIPILALTADAFHGKSDRWRLAGIDAYLTKPLELPTLKSALEHWLRQRDGVAELPALPTST